MNTLYVSDLDGTLLCSAACLSDASHTALQAMLADGLPFAVASARSVVSMRPALSGLELKLPVIELNGAFVSDLGTGRHEIVNALPRELAADIYEAVAAFGCTPVIATFDGAADCLYHAQITNAGVRHYIEDRRRHRDERLRHCGSLADALADQVVSITLIDEEARLAELDLALRARHGPNIETHLFENIYSPGWYWLQVHDPRATKAQGVQTLVELCDLSAEELVVFGDHLNDVGMFGIAHCAVAVENAHPTLKRLATHVIGSNEDDSVVKFIREHWVERRAYRSEANDHRRERS
jgi:Cof subfamily protein (haloacid dehalogenase superfamily)